MQSPPYAGQTLIDHGEAFSGASYYRSWKSCFASKGQTKLLPFVESVAGRLLFDRDTVLADEVPRDLITANARS